MSPMLGLHFMVTFLGLPDLVGGIGFSEVTGLGTSLEVESLEEGGNTSYTYQLPKRTKGDKLTLKRAKSDIPLSPLIVWAEAALYQFEFFPLEVQVLLLNEKSIPIKGWYFSKVFPVKIDYSGVNSVTQSLVIETLELNYQFSSPIIPG